MPVVAYGRMALPRQCSLSVDLSEQTTNEYVSNSKHKLTRSLGSPYVPKKADEHRKILIFIVILVRGSLRRFRCESASSAR